MKKTCQNCDQEIFYYAGFCHHCETKQKYVPIKGREKNIKKDRRTDIDRPAKYTEEVQNNIIVKRTYQYGIIATQRVTEEWVESNGDDVIQTWEGKREKHILVGFIYRSIEKDYPEALLKEIRNYTWRRHNERKIELSEEAKKYVQYVSSKSWIWEISRKEVNLHKRTIGKNKSYFRNGKLSLDVIDEDKTEYYMGVPPFGKKLHYKISNSYCESGILYSPIGEKLYSIINGDGYMLDELDYCLDRYTKWARTLYSCVNGNLKEYQPYTQEFDNYMNKINKEKEELEKRKRKDEYFSDVSLMRENFDPKDYEKTCPDCFEQIKLPAKICRYCNRNFNFDEIKKAIDKKFREIYPEPE